MDEIEAFLTHLVMDRNVAASTQDQALIALLCLYQDMLRKKLERPLDAAQAKKLSVCSGDRHFTHSPTLYSSNCSRTCRAPTSEPNWV